MQLDNGDVIPSFLSVGSTPNYDPGTYFNNITITRGEVVRIIYPDDDDSKSKKFLEYNVYIENRKNNTSNGELLKNCPIWNPLASQADYSAWVFRASSEQPWSKKEARSDGSKVLVIFVHGDGRQAYILGGIRDPNDKNDPGDLGKDDENYLNWIFNGLSAFIDKNGAFKLTFNGPTKNDGKLDDNKVKNEATGTYIEINKDGNLKLANKDDKQYQEINHKDNKINHLADKEYNIKVSNGKIKTDSNGVEVGKATDKLILGDTYRNAQKQLNNKMLSAFQTLQTLAGVAGSQLNTAAAAAAPSGAGPGLAAAGAAMTAMVSQIANLVQAINAFEAQSSQYLSTKNKID